MLHNKYYPGIEKLTTSLLVTAVQITCLKVKPDGTFWVRQEDEEKRGARAINSSRIKTGDT